MVVLREKVTDCRSGNGISHCSVRERGSWRSSFETVALPLLPSGHHHSLVVVVSSSKPPPNLTIAMNPRSSAPCVLCYRLVRTTTVTNRRHYHALTRRRIVVTGPHGTRNIAFVARVIRGVIKLRYLVLGSAVGGGYQLTKVSGLLLCNK